MAATVCTFSKSRPLGERCTVNVLLVLGTTTSQCRLVILFDCVARNDKICSGRVAPGVLPTIRASRLIYAACTYMLGSVISQLFSLKLPFQPVFHSLYDFCGGCPKGGLIVVTPKFLLGP